MTHEEAVQALKDELSNGDTELAHVHADDVLCDLLESLGYGDVVEHYLAIKKWYA